VSTAVARRAGCPRPTAVLFVLAVGGVLALTLTPTRASAVEPPHFLTQLADPHFLWATSTTAPDDAEQLANIALYLPLGFLGFSVLHSGLRSAVFGAALTVLVETCQYGIVGRSGSLTDIRNNTAGALLGALVAAVVSRAARQQQRHQ
jgi:VanZ family protein